MAGSDHNSDIYGYDPSTASAIVATVVFTLLTSLHAYQLFATRTWYFTAFLVGGIFESVGYLMRILSIQEGPDYGVPLYALQYTLILVAPSLLAASMYMELGRIIRLTGGESYAIIRVNWLTKIFVIGDIIAFLVQVGGGGILASSDSASTKDTGETIIIIGLIIQVLFFILFVLTAFLFHWRIAKTPTKKIQERDMPWKKHLITVYGGSVLVLARCIVRLVEYIEGRDGYLLSNEWTLYVFDALFMLLVMMAFNLVHPSEVKALLNGGGRAVHKVVLLKKVGFEFLPAEENVLMETQYHGQRYSA